MKRLAGLSLLVGALAWGVAAAQEPQKIEGPVPTPWRKITLKQMLKTGLKARRPEDFAYVDTINDMVDNGELPRNMVLGTFFYAREQSSYIPLPYFQQALYDRAAKIGVSVPPLEPGPGATGF